MVSLDSFPAEILEKIVTQLPLNDKLSFRKTSTYFNDFLRSRLPQLQRPEHCVIEALKVHKLVSRIRVSTSPIEAAMTLYFVDCTEFAENARKRKSEEAGKIECFLDFEFPPTRQFVLFKEARIGHLEISKHCPIHVEDGNLQHLSAILTGCEIEKITVVLDKKTVQNFAELPQFVSAHHVKHVEFSMQQTFIYDMVEPFLEAEAFAEALVRAGLHKVSFSGRKFDEIRQFEPGNHPRRGHAKPSFAFEVLLIFFRAGIQSITVTPSILENEERAIGEERYAFYEEMASIGRPLRLTLTLHNPIEGLPNGHYKRKADGGNVDIQVNVSTTPHPRRDRIIPYQHLVIECTPIAEVQ